MVLLYLFHWRAAVVLASISPFCVLEVPRCLQVKPHLGQLNHCFVYYRLTHLTHHGRFTAVLLTGSVVHLGNPGQDKSAQVIVRAPEASASSTNSINF